MVKYYTGVGSRDCPEFISKILIKIGTFFSATHILRSGAAEGCDTSFELGCDIGKGKKEIYIPWKGFNHSDSILIGADQKAQNIAKKIHPAWDKLTKWGKVFHGRNVYQVLGKNLKTPSNLLICWTPSGITKGGTATAINLAIKYQIPVYNIGNPMQLDQLQKDFNIELINKEFGEYEF